MVWNPRFSKPMMLMPWAFWQRAMHRPHRMHLEVSRMMAGVSWSTVAGVRSPRNLLARAPVMLATCSSSHWPFFRHCWQLGLWLDSSSSTEARRALVAFSEEMLISIPSFTG